ncbi:hypothetical protein MKW92_009110, partial [Papaver armeniacum]
SLFFLLISITKFPLPCHGCPDYERTALLNFKLSLSDPSNRLSSWQQGIQHENCCQWYGIGCSQDALHVISIDLRNRNLTMNFREDLAAPNTALQGKLSPSLSNITHLEYLDLALNDFQESEIPLQFSHLTKLAHLDLSNSNVSASISTQFNNVTSVRYLDLSCGAYSSSCLILSSTKWLRGLINLQVLKLSGIDLSKATSPKNNFGESISFLSNLKSLDISDCSISTPVFPIHNFHNHSRLSYLKMSSNRKLSSEIPVQMANLTSLSFLDLSFCGLYGSVPCLPQLEVLDVSLNSNLHPDLTRMFQHQWPKLQRLSVSHTNVRSLPSSIYNLLRLQSLYLPTNNITGHIPVSICKILSLRELVLDDNDITGTIPSCVTKLKHLNVFGVSRNSIAGTVFGIIHSTSTPPAPCHYGTGNPLGVSNIFDLSNNKLSGEISTETGKRLSSFDSINLAGNEFSGRIPFSIFSKDSGGDGVDINLSSNKFSGSIPYSICSNNSASNPGIIDFSNNKLSGIIPTSIGYCMDLFSLNLGTNNLTGIVPHELEQLKSLSYLQLNDNNLDGTPLNALSGLQDMEVLNLANNSFEGSIPTAFGKAIRLRILSLRSNKFNGSIPQEINHLENLQILDLSQNNLTGRIPKIYGKYWRGLISNSSEFYNGMDIQLKMVINGIMIQFEKLYNYSSGIDLSCNMLDGNIPVEIGLLKKLATLNLSHNHLSGDIPRSVGNMSSLGSLDLSFNRLSGHIPQSLTSLDFLGVLNLSYNKLSGRIPRGTHFDTLSVDGWAYVGNDFLCGEPSKRICDGDQATRSRDTSHTNESEEDVQEDANERILFYCVIALGFAVGFWGLFFVLLLKKVKWWFPYWRIVDRVAVRIIECITR